MAFMTRTADVQMNGGRPVWSLLSLAVSVLAVAVSIVALAGVGWRTGSHDEHFAAALLIFAVFKYASVGISVCGALAVAFAAVGIVVRRERGFAPAAAALTSGVLVLAGMVGILKLVA